MLQKQTLQFLSDLKDNNNKAWFDENRKRYETAKKDFLSYVEYLGKEIEKFDKNFKYIPGNVKIFRINRDIRFSKDKSPYKTNFGAFMAEGGEKSGFGCYYIHIEPNNNSGIAGGIHMPSPANLERLRKLISNQYPIFKDLMLNKDFKEVFPEGLGSSDKLKTVPRGFDKNDPAAEVLKNKSFTVWRPVKDSEVTSDSFIKITLNAFKEVKKLNSFLNQIFE